MKTKTKKAILASIVIFAMVAVAAPTIAAPGDREMPGRDDPFWTIFTSMNHPTDTSGCQTAVTTYVNSQQFENDEQRLGELNGMMQMCTDFVNMPTQMQSDMATEEAVTNLFDNTSDWHNVVGLYFQKTENGQTMGRIRFGQTIDFMSYEFMSFMNNFPNMVQFEDGYISLNSAMIGDMAHFNATLTMYGLDQFSQQPDIYVGTGTSMRKAVEGEDLSGIVWNDAENSLSFTPAHFSSFRAVAKGSKVATMKITKVDPKSVKYKASKSTFKVNVKGRNLYKKNSDISCMLGFSQASKVSAKKNGKRVICTFSMSEFSALGYYPLTISIIGTGEVTKTNAVRVR